MSTKDNDTPYDVPSGGHTILVVDDEDATRDIFGIYLEEHGYQVRTAATGEEALAQLDDDVAVVLLDRRMPGLPGAAVLDEIRAGPHSCRVAMVTAVAPQDDLLELPVDDYLIKPLSGETLVERVEQLIILDTYETLLTEYHRVSRIHNQLSANKRDRPPQNIVAALEKKRATLKKQLVELSEQLPQELIADKHEPHNTVSVC